MRFLWGLSKFLVTLVALAAVAGLAGFLAIQYATTKESVEVPDLTGLDQAEAARALSDRRLFIQIEPDDRSSFDEVVPAGRVLKQDPPAGSSLKQERRVRVTLSLGPRNIYVPRVVGELLSAAQVKIQQAGLKVGEIAYVPSPAVGDSVVIDQEPKTFARGAEGAVSLLVSTGPSAPSFVMPDLLGKPGLRVRSTFELRGFRVTASSEPFDGVPEGTIVRQRPLAGFPIRSGDSIALWTSAPAPGGGS